VTTIQISGEPGNEDPRILIRAQGTWNNSSPLILVDGIERPMSDINVSEVESVSVLKDASATAVFGVKGAEGVILITTKRGTLGKPRLTVNANLSRKIISKTPDKLNSYDAFLYRNQAIEYEISSREDAWGYYTPTPILAHYKQPQSEADKYIFPDVDWRKQQLNPNASSSQIDLDVQGGTEFAQYFGTLGYSHEGDLLRSGLENYKGYKTKIEYNRFNFRTNLDLNATKTTVFSINLSGLVGIKWGSPGQDIWRPFYQSVPSMYPVRFPDGAWGYYPFTQIPNPAFLLNNSGNPKNIRTQVTTDFILKQGLDFITPGLSFRASLSYDTRFYTNGGISDGQSALQRFIDPKIIDMKPGESDLDYTYGSIKTSGTNDYDWVLQPATYGSENSSTSNLNNAYRRLFYQAQLNYSRKFDKHDVGFMALAQREQLATGSEFPRYREDWVGRLTYNYDGKYLFETNAAYNGSEKFAPKYRFGFFPSIALGWMVSNESFLKKDWLDKLKLRYSIGKVGDDSAPPRWGYSTTWSLPSDRTYFGSTYVPSPYDQYVISTIGNPDIHWEEAVKQNVGLELAVFKNLLNLTVDVYKDDRNNIFLSGGSRNIPNYFGSNPVAANLGKTTAHGYEIELKLQKTTSFQLNYWFTWAYTHAKDKVLYREDPLLYYNYQRAAGFQIGQNRNIFQDGYVNNWNEVYSSLSLSTGNTEKLPGDYNIVDFNGDGTMDSFDSAPYSFPNRPQNTYSFTFGGDWKGFSVMAQFYGVDNVSRFYGWFTWPFSDGYKAVVMENTVNTWRPWNTTPEWPGQRLNSSGAEGTRFTIDGSYLRLKTAEIAYTFTGNMVQKLGLNSAKLYLNGNNLLYFSKMMDDRETDNVTNGAAYPMYRTITLGVSINF
jgi:TonB-linked SusC/RagA family outer membrane protein